MKFYFPDHEPPRNDAKVFNVVMVIETENHAKRASGDIFTNMAIIFTNNYGKYGVIMIFLIYLPEKKYICFLKQQSSNCQK